MVHFDKLCEEKIDRLRLAQSVAWNELDKAQRRADPSRMLPGSIQWELREPNTYYGQSDATYVVAKYNDTKPTWTIACYTSFEGALEVMGDPDYSELWGSGEDPGAIFKNVLTALLSRIFLSALSGSLKF
jgi:hypothetical protein